MNRHILCIDLKSFFASVECVERKLDPFTTPLVVSNPNQGPGAITLAITPYLKEKGIKSRTRLYEIPKNIKYTIVPPRMKLYIEKSKEVVSIYLDFISKEDLHIYSIDACFLDVTNYLKYYNKTDIELAQEILNTIYKKTGLTATCGIGPNLLLAKISMDIEAKKHKNGIAKWTYDDIKTKLWEISPLSKMWGIGSRMERNLNLLGIYKVKDLANYDVNKLKEKFGIIGEELYRHANGIDLSKISSWNQIPKDKSYSHSQILFKDYYSNATLIIKEMTETICIRLRKNHKQTANIYLGIGYSRTIGGGFSHSLKLDVPTDNPQIIEKQLLLIFDKYYDNSPIRKISIALGRLSNKNYEQLNLFENEKEKEENNSLLHTIDKINEQFGKNTILKASSLLSDSTIKERNKKIGGHHE